MLRVAGCITQHHDLGLVALALLVCVLAANASVRLLISRDGAGSRRYGFRNGAAIVAFSAGVWATHFIGVLAYRPGVPFGFDVPLCVLSFALVAGATVLAFRMGRHRPATAMMSVARGSVLAIGIAAMHFTGMIALEIPARLHYEPSLVGMALVSGAAFAIAAMWLLARGSLILTSLFLTLAVTATHFVAMVSVILEPTGNPDVASAGVSQITLASATGGAALVIITLVVAASLIDWRHRERLAKEARRFRTLADATSEGIIFERDGRIADVNRAMCRLAGNEAATLIGLPLTALIPDLTLAPGADGRAAEYLIVCADGQSTPAEVLWHDDAEHTGHFLAVRDLSRQKAAESQIDRLARFDSLTGLANRTMFEQQLHSALARADRGGGQVALHYIDLDRFETVNETYGPRVSEQILIQAATRMSAIVSETDVAARLGSDEFTVIQPLIGHPSEAAALAERIVAEMACPFVVGEHIVSLAANIGIALSPTDGDTVLSLIKSAALARRHAKHHSHGWRCFEPSMDVLLQERRSLELDMRAALQNGEFCLHYQPFFAIESQELAGYEALLRWDHPTRGRISPADFIPLAEECGLIVPIGNWVLATACAEAASWDDSVIISVNLSPAQFVQPGIITTVLDVLKQTNLPPVRLELEITEGTLMDDAPNALRVLTALKAVGVKLAMDDFGTGYSSLSYLRKFPFDKIKIDRSFISDVGDVAEAETIVQAIIALGRSLKLDVTAEGVETRRQLTMLRGQGCTFAQGYLLGRPHPADQLGQHRKTEQPPVTGGRQPAIESSRTPAAV